MVAGQGRRGAHTTTLSYHIGIYTHTHTHIYIHTHAYIHRPPHTRTHIYIHTSCFSAESCLEGKLIEFMDE